MSEYDSRTATAGVAWDTVVDAIRSAIAAAHEVSPRAIVFVKAGQVPKTSSGKVQRSETRRRFLAGELEVLHGSGRGEVEPIIVADVPLTSAEAIAGFMASWLSEALGHPVAPNATLAETGIDSLGAVRLIDALGKRLGGELSPVLAIDYPSLDLLAAHLISNT